MKIRPLFSMVLVKLLPEEERHGSIIIPDAVRPPAQLADVLEVGPGRWLKDGTHRPVDVAVGQRVALYPHDGVEVKIAGNRCRLVNETNILGIVT